MSLRLGFHYHVPVYQAPSGEYRTPGYQGRFLDSLAERCEQLVCFCHSPRVDEISYLDYSLRSSKIEVVDLGPRKSVPRRALRARSLSKPLLAWRSYLDALLIRGPSPLLPEMARVAGDLPTALLLVGNYVAGVSDLPQPRWRKEVIRLWAHWNQYRQMQAAKRSLTFVNSRELYDQLNSSLPNLIETRTTTLSAADFFIREDTCERRPIHLLYSGRMDRGKGLLHIIEALEFVLRAGNDVVLDLVGWPQKGDPVLEELVALSQQLKVDDRVVYHGFKSVGPELFQYYRQTDIYVIASTRSEGFPRTVWEAMAHSVPVVATEVGSIPHFLAPSHAALIVGPRSSRQLADAINEIIHNSALRRSLIANGLALAKENTLEHRACEIVSRIEQWLGENQI